MKRLTIWAVLGRILRVQFTHPPHPPIERICRASVPANNPFDGNCNRVAGHLGPHFDTPIPMGMTAREWDDHVNSCR